MHSGIIILFVGMYVCVFMWKYVNECVKHYCYTSCDVYSCIMYIHYYYACLDL